MQEQLLVCTSASAPHLPDERTEPVVKPSHGPNATDHRLTAYELDQRVSCNCSKRFRFGVDRYRHRIVKASNARKVAQSKS